MRIILAFVFCLISLSSYPQKFNYLPEGNHDKYTQTYEEFTLSYNSQHLQPNWVAYELTAEELSFQLKRKNYFKEDRSTGSRWASLKDYKYSGYDRGHICRAEFCKSDELAYRESFLLSNMSPQIGPSFNRTGGIWHDLEELEMKLANHYEKIYSVSGPIFKNNLGAIGPNKVTVPGYFFKAFLLPDYKAAIGFILRHKASSEEPLKYAVSVDSLESFTGIDFYPSLENDIEDKIEAVIDFSFWEVDFTKSTIKPANPAKVSSAIQCKGKTKSGKRCFRKTSDPSGYCWQHEG